MVNLQYLIDTDWVIHYFKGRPATVARLEALEEESMAISIVTLAELYDGMYGSQNPSRREQQLKDFLEWVTVLGLDEETSLLFGRERSRLRRGGNLPGDLDLLIGVSALRHDLTLLTNNRNHFERIEGLRIESLPPAGPRKR